MSITRTLATRDSLAQNHAGDEEKYSLILASPQFAGSLDYENTARDLLDIVKTKQSELLFLALFLRLLKPDGSQALIDNARADNQSQGLFILSLVGLERIRQSRHSATSSPAQPLPRIKSSASTTSSRN
ncbi:hypothetical protein RP726_18455 [Candidatus Methylospira mobilis]|uniref:hypothetical protein n=1 Tax=Candidatus Methylospira mobilis TaxID=1808979 RepID=UPI0028E33699|nr:hypothetical protein [Candidatus Methylospira mobilis]WNV04360.1 hypothetical protein RP726_18455 [Candidatus Methylospira mobilis]